MDAAGTTREPAADCCCCALARFIILHLRHTTPSDEKIAQTDNLPGDHALEASAAVLVQQVHLVDQQQRNAAHKAGTTLMSTEAVVQRRPDLSMSESLYRQRRVMESHFSGVVNLAKAWSLQARCQAAAIEHLQNVERVEFVEVQVGVAGQLSACNKVSNRSGRGRNKHFRPRSLNLACQSFARS